VHEPDPLGNIAIAGRSQLARCRGSRAARLHGILPSRVRSCRVQYAEYASLEPIHLARKRKFWLGSVPCW